MTSPPRATRRPLARGRTPIEPYAVATDVDAALRARGMAVASTQAEEDEDED